MNARKLSLGLIFVSCFMMLGYANSANLPTEQDIQSFRSYVLKNYIPAMENYRTSNSTFNLDSLERMLRNTPGMMEEQRKDGHIHFRHIWSNFIFELKNRGGEKSPKSYGWNGTFENIQDFINFWRDKIFEYRHDGSWYKTDIDYQKAMQNLNSHHR